MCDRAVFMRQRFCDEIRRPNVAQVKKTHTTAADVRPVTEVSPALGAWLQLAPERSAAVVVPVTVDEQADHPFLSNDADSASSAASSRTSSFSADRATTGISR